MARENGSPPARDRHRKSGTTKGKPDRARELQANGFFRFKVRAPCIIMKF
jgi:hypothetical protein